MGKVEITVVEARNLRNTQLIGVPDPFVRVIFKDKKYKTTVANDTLNPVWNQTFRFQISDENTEQIQLEVWNKNAVSDTLLGYYHISLSGLTRGVVKDEWFILEKSKTLAELRVRILAVDFGEQPTPEQEWMVTHDINHDPVRYNKEEALSKPDQKTSPPRFRPPPTELQNNVPQGAPPSGQYPMHPPMPHGAPPPSLPPHKPPMTYPPPATTPRAIPLRASDVLYVTSAPNALPAPPHLDSMCHRSTHQAHRCRICRPSKWPIPPHRDLDNTQWGNTAQASTRQPPRWRRGPRCPTCHPKPKWLTPHHHLGSIHQLRTRRISATARPPPSPLRKPLFPIPCRPQALDSSRQSQAFFTSRKFILIR